MFALFYLRFSIVLKAEFVFCLSKCHFLIDFDFDAFSIEILHLRATFYMNFFLHMK